MRRYAKRAVQFLEKRAKERAQKDAEEESEESRRTRSVSLLVLHFLNSPLQNYYLSAYCDWMQAIGPESLKCPYPTGSSLTGKWS